MSNKEQWPELVFSDIKPTLETLHQWIQIVGKVRLKTMPWQNHSWHVTLYVSSTGFTTNPIPYQGRIFQIDFNFKTHKLIIECSNAGKVEMDLCPRTVASFYKEFREKLEQLGIEVQIHGRPNEMDPAIPFHENTVNKSYDTDAVNAIWKSMLIANEVLTKFRSDYVGKVSPVHLFWGAFDLAVTRFSGEDAPLHQGAMPNMPQDVMQEAYSKEVSSTGFWLGSEDFPHPCFYAYAYPSPSEYGKQDVQPEQAFWSDDMGEYFLKYEDVRNSTNPSETLLSFLQSTYEASVKTAKWDREKLERQ